MTRRKQHVFHGLILILLSLTLACAFAAGAAEKTVALDTPAYIDPASGRTYLPVRFLAEALGAAVVWNGETSTAYLVK